MPDGSTVDSSEASPRDVDRDIVGVVEFHGECEDCPSKQVYRDVIHGGDWYLWTEGDGWDMVRCHPIDGRWVKKEDVEAEYDFDVMLRSAPTLPEDDWEEIRSDMVSDRDIP